MSDFMETIEYETGTTIQTFNIIEANENTEGYEVLLDIDLDSGFALEGVKLKITHEDLDAYETNDIQEGVKYALGFFDNCQQYEAAGMKKEEQDRQIKNTEIQNQSEHTLKEKNNIKDYDRAWEDDRL
ncbi:hypothetical protein BACCIP111895_02460 [Neobacillus rhizosphaerae]|uniref:DUF1292 domain-containing protein n=1 Tax=Neobacillus rhizosphaerae TaxID=2880965 RepID=A0ABM9ET36_9BACI|nr:hypothetical protein [Neobacillus rhizosphaerae]CAH2715276.1 hypothetical protein BACCIP111895_02460 [Neobacillus rhizosphaerae]